MNIETTIQDTLKEALEPFQKQYVALILGAIIACIGSILVITAPPLMFGLFLQGRKVIKGEKTEATDVLKGFDYFVTSWVMALALVIPILIGFVFLIIPGVIIAIAFAILFQYAPAIAVNEKSDAITALKKSYNLAKENLAYSIILVIILGIINGIGSAIFVGGLITGPYAVIATIIATQKLQTGTTKKKA